MPLVHHDTKSGDHVTADLLLISDETLKKRLVAVAAGTDPELQRKANRMVNKPLGQISLLLGLGLRLRAAIVNAERLETFERACKEYDDDLELLVIKERAERQAAAADQEQPVPSATANASAAGHEKASKTKKKKPRSADSRAHVAGAAAPPPPPELLNENLLIKKVVNNLLIEKSLSAVASETRQQLAQFQAAWYVVVACRHGGPTRCVLLTLGPGASLCAMCCRPLLATEEASLTLSNQRLYADARGAREWCIPGSMTAGQDAGDVL